MGFKEIIIGAIGYVWHYKGNLFKALAIPFGLYMLLDASDLLDPGLAASTVLEVIGVMVQTVFAVTTHRIILLGPEAVPEWGILRWTKRETFFALHVVALVVIALALWTLANIPAAGWLLAFVLILWVVGRLSLVFPAIAIDQGVSFNYAWTLTRHHQLLMVLVVVVFPLFLLVPFYLVSMIPYTFVISSFLLILSNVFTVAALSVAYKLIYKEAYES